MSTAFLALRRFLAGAIACALVALPFTHNVIQFSLYMQNGQYLIPILGGLTVMIGTTWYRFLGMQLQGSAARISIVLVWLLAVAVIVMERSAGYFLLFGLAPTIAVVLIAVTLLGLQDMRDLLQHRKSM